MKFKRKSAQAENLYEGFLNSIATIGVNITQGGDVELRINGQVHARLKIEIKPEPSEKPARKLIVS